MANKNNENIQINYEKWKKILQLLNLIDKKDKKIFFWITMDKDLQKKWYAIKVTTNFTTDNLYINNPSQNFAVSKYLNKTETTKLINLILENKPVIIKLQTPEWIYKINWKINKNSLNTDNFRFDYILHINKKENKLVIKDSYTQNIKNFTYSIKPYNFVETKVIPGILWYSNTWQLVIAMFFIWFLVSWLIIWWFYKHLKQ